MRGSQNITYAGKAEIFWKEFVRDNSFFIPPLQNTPRLGTYSTFGEVQLLRSCYVFCISYKYKLILNFGLIKQYMLSTHFGTFFTFQEHFSSQFKVCEKSIAYIGDVGNIKLYLVPL